MSLPTLDTVQKLQTALHAKAKGEPKFRFYSLYDKVYRGDVLWEAWLRCRENGGAPGVDGQTFDDICDGGVLEWLEKLAEELRTKTYQPQPVRRRPPLCGGARIPKPDGKQRPLGIPTIKDRVVQTAVLIVLEPIFEADLLDEQHAYRPERSALDAVQAVHRLLNAGYTEVVDADLSGYFDSIPHAELMQCVARRVSDAAMLHLLKMWLVAPVEEKDAKGHVHRTTRNKDEGRGSPQGSPISPLLANLYMRRFVLGWKTLGHEQRFRARIVNGRNRSPSRQRWGIRAGGAVGDRDISVGFRVPRDKSGRRPSGRWSRWHGGGAGPGRRRASNSCRCVPAGL